MKKKFDMEQYYNETVPITIMDDGSGSDMVVTLNGYNYIIQKGVTVDVPRKIAMVIEDSLTQHKQAKEYLNSLIAG